MPDYISRKKLKQKVLDRWENEGGRICDEQTEKFKSSSTNRRAGKNNTLQTSESRTADDPKEEKKRS